jgi:hypothetical protein
VSEEEYNETTETEVAEAEVLPAAETQPPAEEAMDEKGEINKLLDEGYNVKQIIDLGFKRRTAYYYAKKRTKPENEPASGNETAPAASNGRFKHDLLKMGSKDVIPPEAVLDVIRLPQDGEAVEVWRRGVLDGVGILLLGARYAQLTASGQAEIVKNQLDIMHEAKESNKDIARETAQQTAMEMANMILQRMPKPQAPSEEPSIVDRMFSPMADLAGKQMANMFGRMFGNLMGVQPDQGNQGDQGNQFSANIPSGWEYEQEGGTGR